MSWTTQDVQAVLDGESLHTPPSILERDDGNCLFYTGKVHSLNAESESAKSWLCLYACKQVIEQGMTALFIDFEDSVQTAVSRLVSLGASKDHIREHFHYMRPDEDLNDDNVDHLTFLMDKFKYALVVIDGVSEAMSTLGNLNPNSSQDVARFHARLPKHVIRPYTAVVMIDHVVKNRDNRGGFAIGSQHKKAGIDVSYEVNVTNKFGRGMFGKSRLTVTKDRPGWVRQLGKNDTGMVGSFYMHSDEEGMIVSIGIEPPPGEGFRPTTLMKKVSHFLKDFPGSSQTQIEKAVVGKTIGIRKAIEVLIEEDYIQTTTDGQTLKHTLVKEFKG